MNLYGLPSPIFFFFTALGGALNYTCLTCRPTNPGFYWSPFSSPKFDLEVAFSFYIFTQNTQKQETEQLAVWIYTWEAGLTAFAGMFLSDPASPMTEHASVSRSVKLIPFVVGGGSLAVGWCTDMHPYIYHWLESALSDEILMCLQRCV